MTKFTSYFLNTIGLATLLMISGFSSYCALHGEPVYFDILSIINNFSLGAFCILYMWLNIKKAKYFFWYLFIPTSYSIAIYYIVLKLSNLFGNTMLEEPSALYLVSLTIVFLWSIINWYFVRRHIKRVHSEDQKLSLDEYINYQENQNLIEDAILSSTSRKEFLVNNPSKITNLPAVSYWVIRLKQEYYMFVLKFFRDSKDVSIGYGITIEQFLTNLFHLQIYLNNTYSINTLPRIYFLRALFTLILTIEMYRSSVANEFYLYLFLSSVVFLYINMFTFLKWMSSYTFIVDKIVGATKCRFYTSVDVIETHQTIMNTEINRTSFLALRQNLYGYNPRSYSIMGKIKQVATTLQDTFAAHSTKIGYIGTAAASTFIAFQSLDQCNQGQTILRQNNRFMKDKLDKCNTVIKIASENDRAPFLKEHAIAEREALKDKLYLSEQADAKLENMNFLERAVAGVVKPASLFPDPHISKPFSSKIEEEVNQLDSVREVVNSIAETRTDYKLRMGQPIFKKQELSDPVNIDVPSASSIFSKVKK